MRNSFGIHGSKATGIWNSIKRNATDPWIIGGAGIGATIGVYESRQPNVYGSSSELGSIGLATGGVAGLVSKKWYEFPTEGLSFFGRGAL